MDADQRNAPDGFATGAMVLTFENHLLLQGVLALVKTINTQAGMRKVCGSISFFS